MSNQSKKHVAQQPLMNYGKAPDPVFDRLNQLQAGIDNLMLLDMKKQQIIDMYRVDIYNQELKHNLLLKLLEERGVLIQGEFDKRWPLYLKNDVGVLGPTGKMEGTLKITKYGAK